MDLARLRALRRIDIDAANARYRRPLRRDATASPPARRDREVVLLGSVASGKYVDPLLPIFGDRLPFPADFVGRGDMSRGGLMLRCVIAGCELPYVPVVGATRRGRRPPSSSGRVSPRIGGPAWRPRPPAAPLSRFIPRDADTVEARIGGRAVTLTNLAQAVLARARAHQARPAAVLRRRRAGAAAAPPRTARW